MDAAVEHEQSALSAMQADAASLPHLDRMIIKGYFKLKLIFKAWVACVETTTHHEWMAHQ